MYVGPPQPTLSILPLNKMFQLQDVKSLTFPLLLLVQLLDLLSLFDALNIHNAFFVDNEVV